MSPLFNLLLAPLLLLPLACSDAQGGQKAATQQVSMKASSESIPENFRGAWEVIIERESELAGAEVAKYGFKGKVETVTSGRSVAFNCMMEGSPATAFSIEFLNGDDSAGRLSVIVYRKNYGFPQSAVIAIVKKEGNAFILSDRQEAKVDLAKSLGNVQEF